MRGASPPRRSARHPGFSIFGRNKRKAGRGSENEHLFVILPALPPHGRSRPPEVPPAELRVRPRMAAPAQPRQVRGVVRPAAPQRHDVVHPRAGQGRPRAAAQHGDDGAASRAPSALPPEHGLPRPRPRGVAVRRPPRLAAPVAARAPAPRAGRNPPAASPAERPRLRHDASCNRRRPPRRAASATVERMKNPRPVRRGKGGKNRPRPIQCGARHLRRVRSFPHRAHRPSSTMTHTSVEAHPRHKKQMSHRHAVSISSPSSRSLRTRRRVCPRCAYGGGRCQAPCARCASAGPSEARSGRMCSRFESRSSYRASFHAYRAGAIVSARRLQEPHAPSSPAFAARSELFAFAARARLLLFLVAHSPAPSTRAPQPAQYRW